MAAKEKAEQLVDKFLNAQSHTEEFYDAKQCALIACEEIISELKWINNYEDRDRVIYWQEVKTEIEQL